MSLSKEHVLITGANRGLGLGFVKHYLAHGWQVVATAVTPEKAEGLRALEGSLTIERLDVTREESIAQLVDRLAQRGIRLDLVISNAGVAGEEAFGEWTAAKFESHLRVNAVGPAMLAQAVAPLMGEGGKLINVSSGMGSLELNINPDGPLDAYAMSKAALNMLTRRLSEKLRPRGITVVSMNPGWVKTDMGGQEAPMEVEESIRLMIATIETLALEHSGSFLTNAGDALPW